MDEGNTYFKRHVHLFVLSSAGKPIISWNEHQNILPSLMGLIQAVNCFVSSHERVQNDSPEKLIVRTIETTSRKFVFHIRGPISLLAVTIKLIPKDLIETLLESVYYQILCILTSKGLEILHRDPSYDLRELLGGTDKIFHNLLNNCNMNPDFWIKGYACLPMEKWHRHSIGKILQGAYVQDILYTVLLSKSGLISLVQPRNTAHSFKVLDLLLVINFIQNSPSFHKSESWTPICLPHFNSRGFLHAYVVYLNPDVCLAMISAKQSSDQFHSCKQAKLMVEKGLEEKDLFSTIEISSNQFRNLGCTREIQEPEHSPSIPMSYTRYRDVYHFIYMDLNTSQYIMSHRSIPYVTDWQQQTLMCRYQRVHSRLKETINRATSQSVASSKKNAAINGSQSSNASTTAPSAIARSLTANTISRFLYERSSTDLIIGWLFPDEYLLLASLDSLVDISNAKNMCRSLLQTVRDDVDHRYIFHPMKWIK